MHILITGAAGFIGYHLTRLLLKEGNTVVGIDNYNNYYDINLKKDRITDIFTLEESKNFTFYQLDISDTIAIEQLFLKEKFTHVVNLAAQAGVRYSLINPASYISSNLVGFANLLEGCRHSDSLEHFVYASSSSVYGLNRKQPYSVNHNVDHPVSLYAATKKSDELMAHAYSHLFSIPCTGLRFFTVYGPWGRPDMALHLFTSAILKGEAIKVFNEGNLRRDFTYVDDIVEGVKRILSIDPEPVQDASELSPSTSTAPWRIYNIGNNQPVELNVFIAAIEKALGMKAKKELLPMQSGDVLSTWADIDDFSKITGFLPETPLEVGIGRFVDWYRGYYKA